MTLCLRCQMTNCIINKQCEHCSCPWFAYLCSDCNANPILKNRTFCEGCTEERKQRSVADAENAPSPLPPCKRQIRNKFRGKRVDKHYEQNVRKRRNKVAKETFRRIKYGDDERKDLGEIDAAGNFSYEGRTWTTTFGIVPLTKRERENANRTNGHLTPTVHDCKCIKYM